MEARAGKYFLDRDCCCAKLCVQEWYVVMEFSPLSQLICAQCGAEQSYIEKCSECRSSPFLDARYQLISVIGQGVEGVTYKASSIDTPHLVTIKERLWKPQHQKQRTVRLEREADVLSQISHVQIPKYYEHFIKKEGRRKTLYIVQEYIEGPTLYELLQKKRFSQNEIWNHAEQMLDILVYLQELSPPIIHRDIKPANVIFCTEREKLVLIDFGSVRDALSDPELGASTYAGTFGYMPPEQIFGHSNYSTDLYSLGALILELLTRRPPSELLQPNQQFHWTQYTSIGKSYTHFVQKLCAKDSKDRFSNARQARSILRSLRVPSPSQKDTEILFPSMEDFRSILREELTARTRQELFSSQGSMKETTVPSPTVDKQNKTAENVESYRFSKIDPLLPTPFDQNIIPRKRGWWKPKPPRPLDEPIEPLHPAIQLSMMAIAVFGTSVLIQVIF
jgi:serine/threonine protein kinase